MISLLKNDGQPQAADASPKKLLPTRRLLHWMHSNRFGNCPRLFAAAMSWGILKSTFKRTLLLLWHDWHGHGRGGIDGLTYWWPQAQTSPMGLKLGVCPVKLQACGLGSNRISGWGRTQCGSHEQASCPVAPHIQLADTCIDKKLLEFNQLINRSHKNIWEMHRVPSSVFNEKTSKGHLVGEYRVSEDNFWIL